MASPVRLTAAHLGSPRFGAAAGGYGLLVWVVAAVAGGMVVVLGLLTPSDAVDVLARVGPVLVFLVAVTVLAELAEAAQVFEVVAVRAARVARGRTPVLFALVVLLATATTVTLSLDTTAVLLTPVVLALAARLGLRPLPFALAAVWLANTASLALPVSNLTNLLAVRSLGLTTMEYARTMALPALAAVCITVAVLAAWQRPALRGRYEVPPVLRAHDRLLFWVAAPACVALAPLLLAGVAVQWAACAAAAPVVVVAAVRRPTLLRVSLLPWRLVVLVSGLFLVVEAAGPLVLDDWLGTTVAGRSPLVVAAVAAGSANVVNNLPAYLALERAVPSQDLLAVLLGVNLGPLVLPWGSLATLLWAERCRAAGVRVPWTVFAVSGLVLVVVLLPLTVPLLP